MTSLVIGAGVAGSVLAALLARDGQPVVLIGPAPISGGFRIGESLPGFAANWLQTKALPGPLSAENPHWAIPGSLSAWNGQPVTESYIAKPWGTHYRLDRLAFDQSLYEAALKAGVDAHPHAATALVHTDRGWQVTLESGEVLQGTHLVDATGRSAWATRNLRHPPQKEDALIAVWAIGSKTAGTDRRTVTETVPEGWWYGCLLPGGHPLACLHCRKQIAAELMRSKALWRHLLAATKTLRSITDPIDFTRATPKATDARGVIRRPVVGGDWIAIGDAAAALDPIASHGISFALFSAEAARACINGGASGDYTAFCEGQWQNYSERKRAFHDDSSPTLNTLA